MIVSVRCDLSASADQRSSDRDCRCLYTGTCVDMYCRFVSFLGRVESAHMFYSHTIRVRDAHMAPAHGQHFRRREKMHLGMLQRIISEGRPNSAQILLVCQVLYALAIALTKIAIISSYLRFIQTKSFRIVMNLTLFVTLGLLVCGIFVSIFQCNPVSSAWEFDARGTCINYVDYLYASSAVNVFTDIVLCVLPIPHLWKLSKSRSQKVWLTN